MTSNTTSTAPQISAVADINHAAAVLAAAGFNPAALVSAYWAATVDAFIASGRPVVKTPGRPGVRFSVSPARRAHYSRYARAAGGRGLSDLVASACALA
jgi:hypothetical protein